MFWTIAVIFVISEKWFKVINLVAVLFNKTIMNKDNCCSSDVCTCSGCKRACKRHDKGKKGWLCENLCPLLMLIIIHYHEKLKLFRIMLLIYGICRTPMWSNRLFFVRIQNLVTLFLMILNKSCNVMIYDVRIWMSQKRCHKLTSHRTLVSAHNYHFSE